jgi:hypothetical protein
MKLATYRRWPEEAASLGALVGVDRIRHPVVAI